MSRRVARLLMVVAVLAGSLPAGARAQDGTGAAAAPPPEVTALLRSLTAAGPEPLLRWDWEPDAFDPLKHPIAYDFTWRLKELARADLPVVARARLNLELAFLDDAAARLAEPGNPERRQDMPKEPWDPAGRDQRLRLAFRFYGDLLREHPDAGDVLTDIGDLHRLAGRPDSAVVMYRRALALSDPPARVFARLAGAELERLSAAPDSMSLPVFREIRRAGLGYFERPAPVDSLHAARWLAEKAHFRIEQALTEFYADRIARPDAWRYAGIDSVFTLLARIVSPPTRRLLAEAADMDTSCAEAYGLLGSVVSGQILLPVAARSVLYRGQDVPADSLALAVWVLARERGEQKLTDLRYAAANLNRCEALEPERYPVVRLNEARLALLFGDVDGAAGLYRALMTSHPDNPQLAEELFTVYRAEEAGRAKEETAPPAAERLRRAIEAVGKTTRSGGMAALLGWAFSAEGKWAEADSAFRAATALDSLAWRAQLGLAVSALRRLDTVAAQPHLESCGDNFVAMDDPAHSVYCGAVGLLYRARRDDENARRWLREALRFDPRNAIAARAMQSMSAPAGR